MFGKRRIRIVWLVNDRYVNNFITVYRESKKSFDFDIKVVAVPRLGYEFSPFISSEEIFEYLSREGIDCVNCYDKDKGDFIDIESFNADYIFTTTPYDIYLPEEYRSDKIIYCAKLCNILYGAIMTPLIEESDYMKNAYMIFTSGKKSVHENNKCIDIGCMKIDEYLHYGRKKLRKNNKFQVAWKPRWTLNENESNLVAYIDNFYKWSIQHSDVELLFISHPMLKENAKHIGWKEYYKYMDLYEKTDNISIVEDGNFMDDVMAADVFIGDMCTTMIEFATTGKPIIYTEGHGFENELTKEVINNSYVARNFQEIISILSDLKFGKDPIKKKREDAAKSYFTVPPKKMSSAKYLLSILKKDFKEHPFIKMKRIRIGDEVIVNGYGSCSAWGEKDNTLKMESVHMKVLDIREDGINKYGCAIIGNSDITCWVGKEDVIYHK
ncbi:CDP-glycerol glycerophosphotransferase family protein [Clostridium aciditolerans]|uniref:CDP-glycerol glycerophosphotransferase family protein n=1 Tax=Clostridium aciditolerans TaxID=339861 RepID=A0A934HSB6_9CLOT|nr:CDP-glycerol glycerophosphotransferase family protein [Clostridium aciditolerans]MBI6873591.1 CDP-glycerol glycerophosphotransferase family protein [Clostridium aciditolerans]